jgi:aspartyl-tRNA(Asn)/glutamyl-tRNA(Gln) amidotransferase subunit C
MSKAGLTKKDILHLAKLANLQLTDEEVEKYLNQLEQTLEYVENLKELDTKNVNTTSHATETENVYFEDGTENTRALHYENKKYKVKRILNI